MEEWKEDRMEGAGGKRDRESGGSGSCGVGGGGRCRGESCLFWSIQVSALFDEDEVKC